MRSNYYMCIVTGEEKYIPPSLLKNSLKKFGSYSEVRKHYVCPKAGKMLRQGKTVDEIRDELKCGDKLPKVDPHVLARLNLLRKKKGMRARADQEKVNRQQYLNSAEFRNKKRLIAEQREKMTFREWVEENTGGPNRAWLNIGRCTGTCIRPDIFLSHNNRACDGCPCYEFCLCRNKRLSHEKKRKR